MPNEESKTVLLGKDQAVAVYRLERQHMTMTFSCDGQQEAVVLLAMGSGVRSFTLSEFIHFWLTMIDVGRKRDIAELESGKLLRRINKKECYRRFNADD